MEKAVRAVEAVLLWTTHLPPSHLSTTAAQRDRITPTTPAEAASPPATRHIHLFLPSSAVASLQRHLQHPRRATSEKLAGAPHASPPPPAPRMFHPSYRTCRR